VKILKNAQEMIRENNFCVLSTCRDDLPNSSLMQYVCNEPVNEIYMLAIRGSNKYLNIISNPHVSFLVDTRSESQENAAGIQALTVYGDANIIEDEAMSKLLKERLVAANPNLAVLADNQESCVIKVKMDSLLILNSVSESRFYKI
jgi:nitroimidazol reductase NimA-like FMN-containing flavoprotein (pyridoxamine 5'-phosphate oxidase superfamily)